MIPYTTKSQEEGRDECAKQSIFFPDLLPMCTDEELINYVAHCYFDKEELGEAQHIFGQSGYEAAIAYLAQHAQESMRKEGHRPSLYLTIPGGKVLIHRPDWPADSLQYIPISIGSLVRIAFPLPDANVGSRSSTSPISDSDPLTLWNQMESDKQIAFQSVRQQKTSVKKNKERPKKLIYQAKQISVLGRERHGWIVKDHGIGYTIVPGRTVRFMVSIIHLKSRCEMTSFIISRSDELAHAHIRTLMNHVAALID